MGKGLINFRHEDLAARFSISFDDIHFFSMGFGEGVYASG
jgi:hypothetical protein